MINHHNTFQVVCFSEINISQGNLTTCLRCGGIFYYHFARNFLVSLLTKTLKIGRHSTKL